MKLLGLDTLLLVILLSFISCREGVESSLTTFSGSHVRIPTNQMDLRFCSAYPDTLVKDAPLRLFTYIDTTECQTCQFPTLIDIEEKVREGEYANKLKVIHIFHIQPENKDLLYKVLCHNNIRGTVYLDTCGIVEKENPLLKGNKLLHMFILNKDNKVVLIGNPFCNAFMRKQMRQVVKDELYRIKNNIDETRKN